MKRALLAAAIGLFAVVQATSAGAAGPWSWMTGSAAANFNEEDRALLRDATTELLENGEDGSVAEWSNPDTGAQGSVKLLGSFTKDGMTCRRLEFRNRIGDKSGSAVHSLCRVEDGTWKFAD
jgi:surface antigen